MPIFSVLCQDILCLSVPEWNLSALSTPGYRALRSFRTLLRSLRDLNSLYAGKNKALKVTYGP